MLRYSREYRIYLDVNFYLNIKKYSYIYHEKVLHYSGNNIILN